jgi:hypothetical protein
MVESSEHMARDEFRGARLRIFGTTQDNPNKGRIFVWTKMGWFERIKGESEDVAFTPVAQSDDELRELVSRDDPSADMVQLGGEYGEKVSGEFMEQSPSYLDFPEYPSEEHDEEDDQQYCRCPAKMSGLTV